MKSNWTIAGALMLVLCTPWYSSCDNSETNTVEEVVPVQELTRTYGETTTELPRLMNGAEGVVTNWPVFDELSNALESIKGATASEIKAKTERLILFTDSLAKTIPDTLDSKPIRSRLLIVDTRVQLLDQEVRKSRPDTAIIESCVRELNMAGSNFINQINEKLAKDRINQERREDEEKELEKQQRFLDSVYQSELEDQNN